MDVGHASLADLQDLHSISTYVPCNYTRGRAVACDLGKEVGIAQIQQTGGQLAARAQALEDHQVTKKS